VIDCVARCAEHFDKKGKLVRGFKNLLHLKSLVNMLASERAVSSVVHLMSLRCFACEDFEWDVLRERAFSSDSSSVVS
jgi:hypothetical protein